MLRYLDYPEDLYTAQYMPCEFRQTCIVFIVKAFPGKNLNFVCDFHFSGMVERRSSLRSLTLSVHPSSKLGSVICRWLNWLYVRVIYFLCILSFVFYSSIIRDLGLKSHKTASKTSENTFKHILK